MILSLYVVIILDDHIFGASAPSVPRNRSKHSGRTQTLNSAGTALCSAVAPVALHWAPFHSTCHLLSVVCPHEGHRQSQTCRQLPERIVMFPFCSCLLSSLPPWRPSFPAVLIYGLCLFTCSRNTVPCSECSCLRCGWETWTVVAPLLWAILLCSSLPENCHACP